MLADAFARKKRVFLPRVVSKARHDMNMLKCFSASEVHTWAASVWGIREQPVDGRAQAPAYATLDVLIAHDVAFSLASAQCGHGMGFYDELLERYERHAGTCRTSSPRGRRADRRGGAHDGARRAQWNALRAAARVSRTRSGVWDTA